MKRTLIAASWLAGTTIPLMLAAVFLFGCCVLPFHHVLHRVMPLCHVAAGILNGNHSDSHDDHHPSPPASGKQKTGSAHLLTILRGRFSSLEAVAFTTARNAAQSRIAYRSFISLGAARCDQDVGLRALLIETFRI